MARTIEFQLYSPTLGTVSPSTSDTCRVVLYGAQFGMATPATSAVDALVGQSLSFQGWNVRTQSFYVGFQPFDGLGSTAADAVAEWERFHRATDAEFRYKPGGGAWSCWPIINDPIRGRGGVTVNPVQAPAAGVDVAFDEWNTSWRWVQITLNAHPFALADEPVATTVSLSGSVGVLDVTGAGEAAATVALSGGVLDKCVVYVTPELPGFSPLCRSHMAAGGATLNRSGEPAFYQPDTGTWRALSGRVVNKPQAEMAVGGGYVVVAHLYNSGDAQTVSIPITVTVNEITSTAVSWSVDLPAEGTFWGGIAGFYIPTPATDVTITYGTVSGIYVDELFVFPTQPDAALWVFDAGSATTAQIASATTGNDTGTRSPWGAIEAKWPVLTSETATIVAASAGLASPTVDVTYRPAFLTFATGEDPT